MISSLKCTIMMHKEGQIIGVCQNEKCKVPNRLVCFKCLQSHLKENHCRINDIKEE